MMASHRPFEFGQRGFVLVSCMLLLLVVTILAVSMFRSFGLDEKIAGNSRDKELALEAAQSAEQYAEMWMVNAAVAQQSTTLTAINCTAVVSYTVGQVCTNQLANPSSLPWSAGVKYNPPTDGVVGATVIPNTVFYIYSLNPTNTGTAGDMYLIDAVAYGASGNTVAEVEAYYQLSCLVCP
jgi:type IV pilus assembly protein PilX